MTWKLDNVEALNKKHPDTFEIPPDYIRDGLIPGDFVKLVFIQENPEAGERMWVEVKRVLKKGYEGVLANRPTMIDGLEFGDVVKFEPKHVADVQPHSSANQQNYTMNGVSEAFEMWRSSEPRSEVVVDESDMWFHAAPEAVKQRSRGRGRSGSPLAPRSEMPGIERRGLPEREPGREMGPFSSRFARRPDPREDFNPRGPVRDERD